MTAATSHSLEIAVLVVGVLWAASRLPGAVRTPTQAEIDRMANSRSDGAWLGLAVVVVVVTFGLIFKGGPGG
jgi:hypothetical protein